MQGSAIDTKSNTGGLQEETKEFKHGMDFLSKAFGSVPHNWIEKSTVVIGVKNKIVKFCRLPMEKWSTKLQLKINQELMQSRPIKINREILQDDSLLPLLFCIVLIPLTHELNRSKESFIFL
jgi:hypothetical protein